MREDHSSSARLLVGLSALSLGLAATFNSQATFGLPREFVAIAIILLPLVGVFFSLSTTAGRKVSLGPTIVAVAYALVIVLSLFISGTSEPIAAALAPGVLAVSMVVTGGLMREREFVLLMRSLVTIGVVQAILAILEVHFSSPIVQQIASIDGAYIFRENLIIPGLTRASGTMGHPILLGFACVVGAVALLDVRILPARRARPAAMVLVSWGVLLSGSRSALAALVVGVLVYFLHPTSPAKRWVRGVIVSVLVPMLIVYLSEAFAAAQNVSLFSLTNRLDALPRFLETFERPILEVLFGQNSNYSLDSVADNQILTTAGRYGILGLVLVLFATGFGLFARRASLSAVVAVVAFMFLSFDAFSWDYSAAVFWLCIGMSGSNVGVNARRCGSAQD